MKLNSKVINDIADKISNIIPDNLKIFADEFDNNCKNILKKSFEKLDLVTRDEFDIQKEVLLITRLKIEKLEKEIESLISNRK